MSTIGTMPGFRTTIVYGITSPTATSTALAVRSSPITAVGGPMSATCGALDRCAVAFVPSSAATFVAHTVSCTVLLTRRTRSTEPVSPGARAPDAQLNTAPTVVGAGTALT